jgi:hypothetical protein
VVRSPREELERIAEELERVIERLRAEESGEALFTREDVEKIVERRLARERRKLRSHSHEDGF